jgi:5-methylcytosine-specific restriction endonuclease McrA
MYKSAGVFNVDVIPLRRSGLLRSVTSSRYCPLMTRHSLLPALPYAAIAVQQFQQACEHITHGDRSLAEEIIRSLDDAVLRAHFDNAQAECGRRLTESLPVTASAEGAKKTERMPGKAVIRAIFERDGWKCRWCSTPVIAPTANKRMAKELPVAYPKGQSNIDIHGLIMCCQGSIDHVTVHSLGGTNEPDNLVTACWPCQFSRGDIDYTRLNLEDPRNRPPVIDSWDGCHWFGN